MIAFLFLVSVIWLGLVLDEEFSISRGDLPVRLASAIVLGAFWGTWLVFLLAWAFGFGTGTLLTSVGIIFGINLLSWKFRNRGRAWLASLVAFDRSFWLASIIPVGLITLYFSACVWIAPNGDILFRGNTRDLAFHMATVSAFVEQTAFPPFNPQSAGAKLSYHFMSDFFAAILCKGGFSLFYSLKIPMVLLAFSLGTLTCHFFHSILKSRAATVFAGFLFFFGHIGIVNLLFGLAGYPSGNVPLSLGSWHGVLDHLTYPYYNFLNVIIDYFQPQLPFLFAFPLAALVLLALYRKCLEPAVIDRTTCFLLAVTAFLPLFHMHTFLTIAPLVGLLVLFERAPRTATVGASAGLSPETDLLGAPLIQSGAHPAPSVLLKFGLLLLAAIPVGAQLAFVLSQQKVAGFSGFDVASHLGNLPEIPTLLHAQRAWFWVRAAGLPLVIGLIGVSLSVAALRRSRDRERRGEIALLLLFVVTFSYFILINFFRFTPNWGDSNKFFLYLDLVLCLYAGRLLAGMWGKSRALRITAATLLAVGAILPTIVEWTERYTRTPERLFSASDLVVADWIRLNTPGDAVFLTANSTVHLVPALAGRRVVNGAYTRETGYADQAVEDLVFRAYQEANPSLITSAKVNYVMVGPAEEGLYYVNRETMDRRFTTLYDQSSRGARYSIYEVRDQTAADILREQEYERSRPFVWLSELKPASVQQQYDTLKINKAVSLQPLTLHGKRYASGLGTHANSEIHFSLDGLYTSFETVIGLDDSQMGGIGTIVFEVWVDDRKVYASKVLRGGDIPQEVKVSVAGAKELKLVVTDAGDGNHFDHGDWADAQLLKKPVP